MSEAIGQNARAATGVDPAERSAALADARRRSSEAALAKAESAEARRADSRQDARAILERALGANTRISIARNSDAQTFVYRAIDVDTGEVVREWPPSDFAQFLADNAALDESDAGALVDVKT